MNKPFVKIRFLVISLSLLLTAFFVGAEAYSIPAFTNYVVDSANVVTAQDKAKLNSYLKQIDEKTGIQLAVLTVPSLSTSGENSVTIEEYATAVFDKWQPGQKKKDNGVLLVVALKERELRIETGYGLEGILTDTKCGLIIRNFIIPQFKEGNYSQGIVDGINTLAGYALQDQEITEKVDSFEQKPGSLAGIIPFAMWAIFILIVVLSNIFGKNHSGPTITSNHNRRGPHDHFGGFGGGFGGGGFGGSGGGFGGGGGGRSGGGGASGRW